MFVPQNMACLRNVVQITRIFKGNQKRFEFTGVQVSGNTVMMGRNDRKLYISSFECILVIAIQTTSQ